MTDNNTSNDLIRSGSPTNNRSGSPTNDDDASVDYEALEAQDMAYFAAQGDSDSVWAMQQLDRLVERTLAGRTALDRLYELGSDGGEDPRQPFVPGPLLLARPTILRLATEHYANGDYPWLSTDEAVWSLRRLEWTNTPLEDRPALVAARALEDVASPLRVVGPQIDFVPPVPELGSDGGDDDEWWDDTPPWGGRPTARDYQITSRRRRANLPPVEPNKADFDRVFAMISVNPGVIGPSLLRFMDAGDLEEYTIRSWARNMRCSVTDREARRGQAIYVSLCAVLMSRRGRDQLRSFLGLRKPLLVRQGAAASNVSRASYIAGDPDSPALLSAIEGVLKATKIGRAMGRAVSAQGLLGLMQLLISTTRAQAILALGQLVSAGVTSAEMSGWDYQAFFTNGTVAFSNGVRNGFAVIMTEAGKMFGRKKVVLQGDLPDVGSTLGDSPFDFLDVFNESELKKQTLTVVGGFFSSKIFRNMPKEAQMFFDAFRTVTADIHFEVEMLASLVKLLSMIGERVSEFLDTGDPLCLLGGGPLARAEKDIMACIRRLEVIIDGQDYDTPVEEVYKIADHLLEKYGSRVELTIKAKLLALGSVLTSAKQMSAGVRRMPASFIIYGPPGIGKTDLVRAVAEVERRAANLPPGTNNVINYKPDMPFQQRPLYTHVFSINDGFQTKEEKAGIPMLSLLQQLADTDPFRLNGASLEEKKHSNVQWDYTFLTTNTSSYLMTCATGGADKLNRRFKVVNCSWTKKMTDLFDKNGWEYYDAKLYTGGKDFDELGWVHYSVQTLVNDNGISFSLLGGKVVFETTNSMELIAYFVECKHTTAEAVRPPLSEVNLCLHGLPLAYCRMKACVSARESSQKPSVWGRPDGDEVVLQGAAPSKSSYDELEEESFGIDCATTLPMDTLQVEKCRPFGLGTPEYCTYYLGPPPAVPESLYEKVERRKFAIAGVLGVFATILMVQRALVVPQRLVPPDLVNVPKVETNVRGNPGHRDQWLPDAAVEPVTVQVRKVVMRGQILEGLGILTCRHLFGAKAEDRRFDEIDFTYSVLAMSKTVRIKADRVVFHPTEDLCLVLLDGLPRLISSFFSRWTGVFDSGPFVLCVREQVYNGFVSPTTVMYNNTRTVSGDCGSLVYKCDGHSKREIVGLHYARTAEDNTLAASSYDTGMAVALTKSVMEELFSECTKRGFVVPALTSHDDLESTLLVVQGSSLHPRSDAAWWFEQEELKGNFNKLLLNNLIPRGTLVGPRVNSRMSGRKTALFEVFGSCVEPMLPAYNGKAVCIEGVWRSPVVKYLNARAESHVDVITLDACFEELKSRISFFYDGVPTEPCSRYEALVGSPYNMYVSAMNAETSTGPVLAAMGVTRKNLVVEAPGGGHIIHEKFLERVNMLEEQLNRGEVPTCVAQATLKDELYPESKVLLEAKGRLFYVVDKAFLVLCRRYLGPILAWFNEFGHKLGIYMNMNPGSLDWELFYRRLKEMGLGKVVELDQTSFDLRHVEMCDYFVRLMFFCANLFGYTPGDAVKAALVTRACFLYVLLMEGNAFWTKYRLLSGLLITMLFNCLTQLLALMYCYARAKHAVSTFWANVAAGCTGDDNLTAVRPDVAFYASDIVTGMGELAYTVTSPKKDELPGLRNLEEATYLKRGFKWLTYPYKGGEHTFLGAPLALASIWKGLCYRCGDRKSKVEEDAIDAQNLNVAAREFFMHGEEVYDMFINMGRAGGLRMDVPSIAELVEEKAMGAFHPWNIARKPNVLLQSGLLDPLEKTSRIGSRTYYPPERVKHSEFGARSAPHLAKGVGATSKVYSLWSIRLETGGVRVPRWFNSLANMNESNSVAASMNASTIPVSEAFSAPVVSIGGVSADTELVERGKIALIQPEGETSLDKFFAVPRKIKSVSSTAVGIEYPYALWSALPSVAQVLNPYYLFRGDVSIQVMYSGNPGMQGVWRLYFIPQPLVSDLYLGDNLGLNFYSADYDPLKNLCRSSQLPHIDVDMSKACACGIDLSWALPIPTCERGLAPNGPSDWIMSFGPLTPYEMANSTTPDAFNIDVYASYKNVRLLNLVPQGGEAPAGALSRGLEFVSDVASMVPLPIATPISILFKGAAGVAKWFGWSRPPVEVESVVLARHVGAMSAMTGVPDMSYHLGSAPYVQHDVSNQLIPLSRDDDGNIKATMSKWSLISIPQPTNQLAVHPGVCRLRDDGALEMTPMAFVASAFTWWRGSIKLKFGFSSSSFIRTRIGINVYPPGATVGLGFVSNGTVLSTIVDLVGSMDVEVDVPYMQRDQMAQVLIRRFQDVGTYEFPTVVWYILAGPVGPSPSAPNPRCLLWIKAGDDMELAYPSLHQLDRYTLVNPAAVAPLAKPIVLQGGTPMGVAAYTFGERFDDMKMLCRRYCEVLRATPDTSGTEQSVNWPLAGVIPTDAIGGGDIDPNIMGWSYATWFRQAFLGWTGGHSWIVATHSTTANPGGVLAFSTFGTPGVEATRVGIVPNTAGAGAQVFRQYEPIEVSVPNRSYFYYNQVGSYLPPTGGAALREVLSLQRSSYNALETLRYEYYHAGADDYTFGGWLCAPAIYDRDV